jgi:hypothetical protein
VHGCSPHHVWLKSLYLAIRTRYWRWSLKSPQLCLETSRMPAQSRLWRNYDVFVVFDDSNQEQPKPQLPP